MSGLQAVIHLSCASSSCHDSKGLQCSIDEMREVANCKIASVIVHYSDHRTIVLRLVHAQLSIDNRNYHDHRGNFWASWSVRPHKDVCSRECVLEACAPGRASNFGSAKSSPSACPSKLTRSITRLPTLMCALRLRTIVISHPQTRGDYTYSSRYPHSVYVAHRKSIHHLAHSALSKSQRRRDSIQ